MATGKLRVAVVGVGGMGSAHCGNIGRVAETELTAVVDVNAGRARQIGEQYGVPSFTDHREVLRGGLADAVVIATPHYFHPPIAVDAFRAGLHVLSEKPLGVCIGAAEKMAAAARRSGKVFGVMFQMRSMAVVQKACEVVKSGALGEVRRTMLMAPEFRSQAYYDSGSWRATWGGEGGGVLLNQGPHIMDIFVSLGGMPSRVHGRCATLLHDIEVEDHAEALLEYPDGASGYFYVSTCEVGPRIIEVVGDGGKLRLDGNKLSFWRYRPGVTEFNRTNTEMWGMPGVAEDPVPFEECENGHHVILRNFARAALYGEPLTSPGEAGLASLELANAILLSSRKRCPVRIPIDRAEYDALIEKLKKKSRFSGVWDESKAETDPRFAR